MPTGLTSKIYEGEDMSLRGFALMCVKQLGYGYYASGYGEEDLPLDKAPVIKPKRYHKIELDRVTKQYEKFKKLQEDTEALMAKYEEVMSHITKDSEDSKKKNKELQSRYESVLEKVNRWDVPEELSSLKNLMTDQLNDSIKYDCRTYEEDEERKNPTLEEWVNSENKHFEREIEYHTKEYAKDVEYSKECNEYIKKLYEELDKAEPLA